MIKNYKDSSEDEDTQNLSSYSKPDNYPTTNKSPVTSRPVTTRISSSRIFNPEFTESTIPTPPIDKDFVRYSEDLNKNAAINLDSDEESEEENTQKLKLDTGYDFKQFENLEVSSEVKECFQNILRYTPQEISLKYKLIPFLPNYIPAVGDVDAFIKIPRPDGVADKVGLTELDEPNPNQSEPAVLHLQLRSKSKSAGNSRQTVIKRVDYAEKNPKAIDKWIEDMDQLHRIKHPPAVHLTNQFPDIDALIQQWPPEVEEKLNDAQIDFSKLDCSLPDLVDIVCSILDIPVFEEARLESLHTLFSVYLSVRNIKDHPDV